MSKNWTREHPSKEFTDALMTAYLDLRGFHIKPITLGNKQIAFEIYGEHLTDAIQEFYENPKVPVLNFCASYKKVRSMIFNLKAGERK
jgi:hypothetical protein